MEPIRKINMSDTVNSRILGMIQKGQLKPGEKLPTEAELCKMLGASRTVIREGIRGLARSNVVVAIAGRGTFVNAEADIMVDTDSLAATLSREMIEDIYEVRSLLDTGIARYAAIRATEKDIENIEGALSKTKVALESGTVDRALSIEGDEEFHKALCEATHNNVLRKIAWPITNHELLRIWKQRTPSDKIIREAYEGHRRIAEAVKRKDPDGAVIEMERHLHDTFEKVYRLKAETAKKT
jgi:GntR family transcriptional repressor for pyruvate dehydrogenase complex